MNTSTVAGRDYVEIRGRFRLASLCGGHSGMSAPSISSYRRMLSFLLARWQGSILRIVGGELYRLPLRIQAILSSPTLRSGAVGIPRDPAADSDSVSLNHNFAHACSDYILQQKTLNHWIGNLD